MDGMKTSALCVRALVAAALLAVTALAPAATSVTGLVKVSETRISRTVYDYVYRVKLSNSGPDAATSISATLTGAGPGTTIIDGVVVIGDVPVGGSVTPGDTITLRHDRAFAFNTSALVWSIGATTIACTYDTTVPLAFEERRLTTPMPTGTSNTIGTDTTAVADRITRDTGFDVFAPAFAALLCPASGRTTVTSYDQALAAVKSQGTLLWRAAVDRVQGRRASPVGSRLPNGDDRMLYWARVQMTKVLRQWAPSFAVAMSDAQKEELQWQFERHSRGQLDIHFPAGLNAAGKPYRRLIMSGFDVFTLGTPGTPNTGLRNGNPSAATAIAMDGKQYTLADGSTLHVETYILPVSYDPFNRGMQEDTLGPHFQHGAKRVDASLTMSQGSNNIYNLEQFNSRFHGPSAGNDGMNYCPGGSNRLPAFIYPIGTVTAANTAPVSQPGSGCDIYNPARWLGYDPLNPGWQRDFPPQFSHASLPMERMVTAKTYEGVTRPPGANSAAPEGFDVTWHTNFTYFPNCAATQTTAVPSNNVVNAMPTTAVPFPDPTWCARSGGGGDYLSNESAYRNTVLRDSFGLQIPAGHIHVPVMNNFFNNNVGGPRDDNSITDARFEAYRSAIVKQGEKLVLVVGNSLIAP